MEKHDDRFHRDRPVLHNAAEASVFPGIETRTLTSYGDLATTGPAVTVVVGQSGLALVVLSARQYMTAAGAACIMSVALSGANTLAAADVNGLQSEVAAGIRLSRVVLLTGLTPGSTTFTAKYRVSGGTGNWDGRAIVVVPL